MANKTKIVTHNAKFHSDDVFAVATLLIYLDKKLDEVEIIRTRDEEIIKTGDYVVDVGNIYDPESNRFDHHQMGGAGKRENGIEYASFGLVWKKFGEKICGSEETARLIENKLVQVIDAGDNGIDISKPIFDEVYAYGIWDFISLHIPTWKEEQSFDKKFLEAILFAKKLLEREIKVSKNWVEASSIIINMFENSEDKRLVIFNKEHNYGRNLIDNTLVKFKEPLYAILPRPEASLWQAIAIHEGLDTYNLKKPFPKDWMGKRDEELQKVSGVSDAIFCHKGGFMCVAESKEGAIKLAKLALDA